MYKRNGMTVLFLLALTGVSFATPLTDRFSSLWVLGDSLSDSGNLFTVSGGTAPDPDYYDDGRFQNGPNYADLLWQELGFSGELVPSYQGGTNYAVGGARSLAGDGFDGERGVRRSEVVAGLTGRVETCRTLAGYARVRVVARGARHGRRGFETG